MKDGSGSLSSPSSPIKDAPTASPKIPKSSLPPLCSAQPTVPMRQGGVQPPVLLHALPAQAQPGWASLQELGCIPRARWSPDSRDEPGVARVRGPPLSAGAAGPCHNEPCIELLLPNRWRLQAQGEAKVRGQGEQSGSTAPLPTQGEGGATRPPRCVPADTATTAGDTAAGDTAAAVPNPPSTSTPGAHPRLPARNPEQVAAARCVQQGEAR